MPKKRRQPDRFANLTWNDLEAWAGDKIVSRGKNYQRQGLVVDLAVTENDGLIAWVEGTERYATQVVMADGGQPDSICTCPYEFDCKHAVAVVIEYLKHLENDQPISRADDDDTRLKLLQEEGWNDEDSVEDATVAFEDLRNEIDSFLKGKTKAQLIDLIHDIAQKHPEMAQEISDRRQLTAGQTKTIVARLRREIQEVSAEPGWQNYWRGEGYTPDYSGIRRKLEALLGAGHADEVLTLGRELISTGTRLVEESHDEGETAMEIAACLPVIIRALEQSALDKTDKLNLALDAVLEDQYGVCEDLAEYLHRKHARDAWHKLSARLLARLKAMKHSKKSDDFSRRYERDRISDWAIHALERAGRQDEIIPLCEAEVRKTDSYERLVSRLVAVRRYEDAERWIRKGIRALKDKYPGITAGLRKQFREIRERRKDWPIVAAIQAEEFVRHPSPQAFTDCKKAAAKVKVWPAVRESLLQYLENGELPWKQKGWPLPESGLVALVPERKDRFPMVIDLIEIALLEKKPDQVLFLYDQLPRKGFGWRSVDDNAIATAVQTHAPDRAVAIWKNLAERLIARVKPKAYREAGKYLRKAANVMAKEKKHAEWDRYLKSLRKQHARKVRLMEVLDRLDNKPIIKKRR